MITMAAGERGLRGWVPPVCLTLPFLHCSFYPSLFLFLPPYRCVPLSQWTWPPVMLLSFLPRPSLSLSLAPPSWLFRALRKSMVSHCYFCLQPHRAGQMSLRVPNASTIYQSHHSPCGSHPCSHHSPCSSHPSSHHSPPWLPSLFLSP